MKRQSGTRLHLVVLVVVVLVLIEHAVIVIVGVLCNVSGVRVAHDREIQGGSSGYKLGWPFGHSIVCHILMFCLGS